MELGTTEQFEKLRATVDPEARRWLRRFVHNPDEREDILQDAYVKAFRAYAAGKVTDHTRAWFFQILRRTIIDRARRRQVRVTTLSLDTLAHDLVMEEVAAQTPTPEEQLLSTFIDDDLAAALRGLKPDQARALIETAENLSERGSTPSQRSLLNRARRAVKASLSELALQRQVREWASA